MPSVKTEDLSPFGRAALKLDYELSELARVGGQIVGVDLESDNGLDEGIKILNRVAKYGQSVADSMVDFSKTLQEARDKAEAATKIVAEKAQVIQSRKQTQDQIQEKLALVRDEVKRFGEGLAAVGMPANAELSDEDKRRIAAELERLREPLTAFIESIKNIKSEAARSNFKRLERQADSMIDSLQSTLRKITQAVS